MKGNFLARRRIAQGRLRRQARSYEDLRLRSRDQICVFDTTCHALKVMSTCESRVYMEAITLDAIFTHRQWVEFGSVSLYKSRSIGFKEAGNRTWYMRHDNLPL